MTIWKRAQRRGKVVLVLGFDQTKGRSHRGTTYMHPLSSDALTKGIPYAHYTRRTILKMALIEWEVPVRLAEIATHPL